MGRAKEILAEFGTQLGRALLALLLQFSVPIIALYLALVVPPLVGCLSYSDRPGPGCYGLSSRVGLGEAREYATAMLDHAFFAARFLWPSAFLCTFLALVTKWRPRTQWVRSVLLGALGFVGTGYLTAAAGWYFALSGTAVLVVAAVGAAFAACALPRLIAPGQRSNRPLEPTVGSAARGSTPLR